MARGVYFLTLKVASIKQGKGARQFSPMYLKNYFIFIRLAKFILGYYRFWTLQLDASECKYGVVYWQ